MIARDMNGNTLSADDLVTFPLGFGQMGVGQVRRTPLLVSNPNEAPSVEIGFSVTIPLNQQGVAPAVVKIGHKIEDKPLVEG